MAKADPNLMEDGIRTYYPKWVDHPTLTEGVTSDGKAIPIKVIVADAEAEAKLLGGSDKKPKDWK